MFESLLHILESIPLLIYLIFGIYFILIAIFWNHKKIFSAFFSIGLLIITLGYDMMVANQALFIRGADIALAKESSKPQRVMAFEFLHKEELLNELTPILDLSKESMNGKVDISEIELPRADLSNTKLTEVILTKATLPGANLVNANLTKANLKEANLEEANFTNANLTEANLAGADLKRTNLTYADLTDADLFRATLTYADLTYADLRRANLTDADLSYTELFQAIFWGANISNADFTGAKNVNIELSWIREGTNKNKTQYFPKGIPQSTNIKLCPADFDISDYINISDYLAADGTIAEDDLKNAIKATLDERCP